MQHHRGAAMASLKLAEWRRKLVEVQLGGVDEVRMVVKLMLGGGVLRKGWCSGDCGRRIVGRLK